MYFGTPSSQGKFYKGLSSDTPVNHDLHWRDRVVKENHMVKALEARRGRLGGQTNADMFIKRPWTEEEDAQLADAVRKHGPNNWEVACRDRTFLEMIGNHTIEDIKTRWRLVERTRRTRRNKLPPSGLKASMGHSGGGAGGEADATKKLGVMNQLKLKSTLMKETEERQKLASQIERERRARLEAEKQAALQMRERKRLAAKLSEFETLVKSASAPALPPLGDAGRSPSAPEGDEDAAYSYVSGRSGRSHRSHRSRRSHAGSGVSRKSRDTARSMASHLSRSSAALMASHRTRERAREMLDSLREREE